MIHNLSQISHFEDTHQILRLIDNDGFCEVITKPLLDQGDTPNEHKECANLRLVETFTTQVLDLAI